MSFTSDVKNEISENKQFRSKYKRAFQCGMNLDVNREILSLTEEVHAFIAGAFFACGNITNPQKGYHLEFVVKNHALCEDFAEILTVVAPNVRRRTRRGAEVFYYKGQGQIGDILTAIGATKAALAMIDVEVEKSVRNLANRTTNCETANIDKTVNASARQVEDIHFILKTKGESWLPSNLQQVAAMRAAHPELSLRELAEEIPGGISRSGLYHRLLKLQKMAEELREEGK